MNTIRKMVPTPKMAAMLMPAISPGDKVGLGGFSAVVLVSLKSVVNVKSVLKLALVSEVEDCCVTVDVCDIFEPGIFK